MCGRLYESVGLRVWTLLNGKILAYCSFSLVRFLADRTIGRAYGTVCRLSSSVCRLSVTFCIVAKRCVLAKKCLKE